MALLPLVHVVATPIELHAGLERVFPGQVAEESRIDLGVDTGQAINPAHVIRQIRLGPADVLKRRGHVQQPDVGPREQKERLLRHVRGGVVARE